MDSGTVTKKQLRKLMIKALPDLHKSVIDKWLSKFPETAKVNPERAGTAFGNHLLKMDKSTKPTKERFISYSVLCPLTNSCLLGGATNIDRKTAVDRIIYLENKGKVCFLFRGDPANQNIEYRTPV